MKLTKKLVVLALAAMMLFSFTACGGSDADASGVKSYTVEANFNSETVNQWKTIALLDEDTYIISVDALDSKDNTKVTADFIMKGKYTLDGNTLTIEFGYGSVYALNGDTPITMQLTPDTAGAMYAAMMGTQGTTFILNEDGTWSLPEE